MRGTPACGPGVRASGSIFRKEFSATLGPVEALVAAVVVEEEQDAEILVPEGAATECEGDVVAVRGVHLDRKRVVVEQRIGRGARTVRRKAEVVNARGQTDVGFHEEEAEFKVADGGKQPGLRSSVGVSVVEQAGQEPGGGDTSQMLRSLSRRSWRACACRRERMMKSLSSMESTATVDS